jgi:hypothetical protein
MNRITRRLVGLLFVLAFIGALLFSQRPTDRVVPLDVEVLAKTIDIVAPSTLVAGSPFEVNASLKDSSSGDTTVTLDLVDAVGVTRLTEQAKDGHAFFRVSGEDSQKSGVLRLIATTTTARGEASVQIQPGRAVDGIVPLAGPKAMIADGIHSALVNVIPTDTYGNPLPENTSVTLYVRRPNDSVETVNGTVGIFLAGIRVKSGTVAGRTTMRVEVDGATGPEIDVIETPGSVVLFSLVGPTGAIRADGRSVVELSTPQLADRYGNVLLDGTSVSLQGDGPQGRVIAVTSTVDGRAFFRLAAPSAPGRMSLVAFVGDVPSSPIGLEIAAVTQSPPFSMSRIADDVEVRVGPVLTELGGFVPDGTTVSVIRENGETKNVQLRSGIALIRLPLRAGETFTVSVLDIRKTLVAP